MARELSKGWPCEGAAGEKGWGGQHPDRLYYTPPPPNLTHTHTHILLSPLPPLLLLIAFRISGGQRRPNHPFPSERLKPPTRVADQGTSFRPQIPCDLLSKWSHNSREKKRGEWDRGESGGEGGGPLKIYLCMLKKMLICLVKNRGGFDRLLILLLLNSRADGRDWHGDHVWELFSLGVSFTWQLCLNVWGWGCQGLSHITFLKKNTSVFLAGARVLVQKL